MLQRPLELWLAAAALELGVSEAAGCGFRLTCGLKRLLLYVGEGKEGITIPHGVRTFADAIVPDGWH
jgi:hypothetical protein